MPTVPGFSLHISDTPLRRINTRGRVCATGRFASRKMGRCLPWESSGGLAWLRRAELDPCVTAFFALGVAIELDGGGGRCQPHIPFGVAVRHGRVEVHDVARDCDIATKGALALAAAAARHLAPFGATYGFAPASSLEARPIHANMQDVLRRLHRRVPDVLARRLVATAQDTGPLPVAALASATSSLVGTPEDVFALVARGRLRMDLRYPVTAVATVWTPETFPDAAPILPPPLAPWSCHDPLRSDVC